MKTIHWTANPDSSKDDRLHRKLEAHLNAGSSADSRRPRQPNRCLGFIFLMWSLSCLSFETRADEHTTALDYPSLLTELGVPALTDATIVALSPVFDSRDGGFIVLESGGTDAELREFYEQSLADTEWVLAETKAATALRAKGLLNNLPFLAVFTKPGWRLHCLASTFDDQKRLRITLTPRREPSD